MTQIDMILFANIEFEKNQVQWRVTNETADRFRWRKEKNRLSGVLSGKKQNQQITINIESIFGHF